MENVESHTDYTVTLLNVPLLLLQFIMLTYIFMLAWLGVTAFTSLPVFIYFNIWNICQNATVLDGTTLCLDPRQYGKNPTHTHTHTHTHTDPAVQHLSHLCQTVDTAAFILLWGLFVSTSSAIFSHIKGNTFIKWATSDMKSCKRPTLKVMFSVLRFMIYSTISLFLFTLLSW